MAKVKKEEKDPNYDKNGLWIGKCNDALYKAIQEYKEYALKKASKNKDFEVFSQWYNKK